MGLSPRMRGNLLPRLGKPLFQRSIPAYAGEPSIAAILRLTLQVYPRVCGGTAAAECDCRAPEGLSPRMRGNPGISDSVKIVGGSIPAYAGEPRCASAT